MSHLSEEPCHDVAENDRLVRLVIIGRCRDTGKIPQIGLPFVHPAKSRISSLIRNHPAGLQLGLDDGEQTYRL